jgi:RNA-directed DNA polymerase
MSAAIEFRKAFSKAELQDAYNSAVRYRSAVGVDRVNTLIFEKDLDGNIDIIRRKVLMGTYRFSQYREKLLPRGNQKIPRVISIPTLRDKLTLKALTKVLSVVYSSRNPFVHKIIEDIASIYLSGIYDTVMRFDVKDFYPSIKHDCLFEELKKKIKKREIISLMQDALRQSTVPKPQGRNKDYVTVGVAQGLSISNILADIYMLPIDKKHKKATAYKYFRYVDDILILCEMSEAEEIKREIIEDCYDRGLRLHDEKSESVKATLGKISDEFTYLGYVFGPSCISVRKPSLEYLRESIIKIFTNYKYFDSKNELLLKWALDLRVTGCLFNNTRYGWLFFFSQINDMALLHSLDKFVEKMCIRFNVDVTTIRVKRFVRAYHEIRKNMNNTSYIPNFDAFSTSGKRKILSDVFSLKTRLMSKEDIDYQFKRRIHKTVRDLEKDLARNS